MIDFRGDRRRKKKNTVDRGMSKLHAKQNIFKQDGISRKSALARIRQPCRSFVKFSETFTLQLFLLSMPRFNVYCTSAAFLPQCVLDVAREHVVHVRRVDGNENLGWTRSRARGKKTGASSTAGDRKTHYQQNSEGQISSKNDRYLLASIKPQTSLVLKAWQVISR